jgi:hypothetical protein
MDKQSAVRNEKILATGFIWDVLVYEGRKGNLVPENLIFAPLFTAVP